MLYPIHRLAYNLRIFQNKLINYSEEPRITTGIGETFEKCAQDEIVANKPNGDVEISRNVMLPNLCFAKQ